LRLVIIGITWCSIWIRFCSNHREKKDFNNEDVRKHPKLKINERNKESKLLDRKLLRIVYIKPQVVNRYVSRQKKSTEMKRRKKFLIFFFYFITRSLALSLSLTRFRRKKKFFFSFLVSFYSLYVLLMNIHIHNHLSEILISIDIQAETLVCVCVCVLFLFQVKISKSYFLSIKRMFNEKKIEYD